MTLHRNLLIILLLVLCLLGAGVVLAQDLSLSWTTVASGGGVSTGGPYALTGSIGQSEAGGPTTGGGYTLSGGVWGGGEMTPDVGQIYLPAVQK